MGYGRNALWLAEQGYVVEGWETDRRYLAEARREARRRGVRLKLRRARAALAPGGQLFLLAKLTRDRYFRRVQKDPNWAPVPEERNTLRRRRAPDASKYWRGRKRRRRWILSALTPGEIRNALRGPRGKARGRLRIVWYRERVLRSDWDEPRRVTHHLAEVVAQKPRSRRRTRGAR